MEPFDADDVAGRAERRLTRQPESLPILLQQLGMGPSASEAGADPDAALPFSSLLSTLKR